MGELRGAIEKGTLQATSEAVLRERKRL